MRTTITTLLLFIFAVSFSQGRIDPVAWEQIESDILDKKNLEDVSHKLQQIKESAIEREDDIAAARSLYLLMHIADRKTEDSLFLINSGFIDSVLAVTPSPRMSAIMHLIKAKRLMYFRQKLSGNTNAAFFRSAGSRQYALLSKTQLDSICKVHFDKALILADALKDAEPSSISWLSYDPSLFLFKPDFRDIVFAEKLFFLRSVSSYDRDYYSSIRLNLSPEEFFALPDSAASLHAGIQEVFRTYRDWANAARSARDARFYYIESLAHAYLFEKSSQDSASGSMYELYLERQLNSPYGAVKGFTALCLAGLWQTKGMQYYKGAIRWYAKDLFDEDYRPYYAKAHHLITQYLPLLDSFPGIQDQLKGMKSLIEENAVRLNAHREQLPGQPVASVVMYRNTRELHIGIVKVSVTEKFPRNEKRHFSHGQIVRDTVYRLAETNDFQWHASYLKLDGLPAGKYLVFSSGTDLRQDTAAPYFELSVSNIVVLNNDHRVFVLNRTTGFPLTDAAILVDGKHQKVNASGYVTVTDLDKDVIVTVGKDSLLGILNSYEPEYPDEIYNSDAYDNLMEYYEDNIRLRMFTDRGIYRPGQMVYYKGIFTVPDPRTGEWRVLNWKNLKAPFLKKLFYKLALKFQKEKIGVNITDAFGHDFKELKIWPDKFGSFSGSFVLPKNAATGEWKFECDMFDIESDHDVFSVEEYKRPSFELTLKKPERELRLGDDFDVLVKTRSFAGAKLDGVNLKYVVTVQSNGFDSEGTRRWGDTLMTGNGITDLNGEMRLSISDSAYLREHPVNWEKALTATYAINIQAIDRTGESHEEDLRVTLSARPVKIKIDLPKMMDRADIKPLRLSAQSDFAGQTAKQVSLRLRRITPDERDNDLLFSSQVDTWIHSRKELNDWFPEIKFYNNAKDTDPLSGPIVFDTTINTGTGGRFVFPYEKLEPGSYVAEMFCTQNDSLLGELSREFTVFDSRQRQLPAGIANMTFLPYNSVNAGKELELFTGNNDKDIFSIFHLTYFKKGKKKVVVKNSYDIQTLGKGLSVLKFAVPSSGVEAIEVTHQYVLNNKLYITQEVVHVVLPALQAPELVVEQYRTKLTPGSKETFRVSIRSKDLQKVNQLMTVLYDASLDKLVEHNWKIRQEYRLGIPKSGWSRQIGSGNTYDDPFGDINSVSLAYSFSGWSGFSSGGRVWWQNDSMLASNIDQDEMFVHGELINSILKRTTGLAFAGTQSLQEVVVTAYGLRTLAGMSAGISIRGNASVSLANYSSSLIVIDGVIYEGDISKIDVSAFTDGIILNGADATALYGSRAANGLVLLSTKGPVAWPVNPPEPTVLRQNFSETAFFYPKILADKNGVFTINFTLPESVTEWKWKMLAHDKHARFTYAERTIVSQLPMMVQPEMPRFLYQGDQMILKSRISNLDSNIITGTVKCVVEDVVTGNDITSQLLHTPQQTFSVKAMSNSMAAFRLNIPDTMIHPLRVRIVALGNNVSDGEEHIIPVLSKKILVTGSVPLIASNVSTPALPPDAQPYGVSAYIQSKPYAGILQALPYLANYAYDCSEQTFNKMLAHAMAAKLMRHDTALQHSYTEFQDRPVREVVPADSLAQGRGESMPWLQIEFANDQHQRQLFALLDTLSGNRKIRDYLDVLHGNQQTDGGLSWFKGGRTDPYISLYLLAGLGKMKRDSLWLTERPGSTSDHKFIEIVSRLVKYTDALLKGSEEGVDKLFALYARSYWFKDYPPGTDVKQYADSISRHWLGKSNQLSFGRKAMLITSAMRISSAGSELFNKAKTELESLRQQSISDANGIRWKIIADSDDLSVRAEEWLVKIAEAFEESGSNNETVNGIIKWLLHSKQDHQWSTTKSTGDAVALLSRHQVIDQQQTITANADGGSFRIAVSDDLLTGQQFGFFNLYGKSLPTSINVSSNLPNELRGSLNYYYFTTQPPQDENGPSLTKTISRYDDSVKTWVAMNEKTVLRVGDKVKVKLTIETKRRLQYVFIDDKRAAAFEPADPLSGYDYGEGLGYYRSVADEGFRFFASGIPAGRSSIEYEMITNGEGVFSNGTGVLQCIYSPEVKAYTQNLKVTIVAK